MGRRSRRRNQAPKLRAPESSYTSPGGDVLVLRGSLTAKARREYADAAAGGQAATREDDWQRAVELLFERLAVRWDVAGAPPLVDQQELLARYRFASAEERRWIRSVLREHLGEHFPELEAP